MTWQLRIFFSFVFVLPALAVTLAGQVELVDSREPTVRKQRNFSGVVVWLDPTVPTPLPAAGKPAAMLQKGKEFIPHVLAVTVGSTVEFPNLDPIFHNAFSNFDGQPFDTGLYPPGGTQRVTFRRDGIVRVFCNIHSFMSAVIVVLRTPYFATTDRSGAFRIANVPPGEYQLHLWHERATERTLRSLSQKIVVQAEGAEPKLNFRISELGYLEVPHKNKYGKDYPAESGYGGPSAP